MGCLLKELKGAGTRLTRWEVEDRKARMERAEKELNGSATVGRPVFPCQPGSKKGRLGLV
jgi:hypothetical protein